MENIYLILCDSGNCNEWDHSYQNVESAWKNYEDAIVEKGRLEMKLKQRASEENSKVNLCSKCPLNNYAPKEAEQLVKTYCKDFVKSDDSDDDETFCDNKYMYSVFLDDWYNYSIKEINLN